MARGSWAVIGLFGLLFCAGAPIGAGEASSVSGLGEVEGVQRSEPVGIVLASRGEVFISREGHDVLSARTGTKLFNGDRIETSYGAVVQISFIDRSKITLLGSSDLTIDEYAYGNGKKPKHSVKIQNGAMSFMAGKMARVAPQDYKIVTVTAVVGIRGSAGELQTSDGTLEGVERGLALMMTGGIGLTVAPEGREAYDVDDISRIGSGIEIDSEGHLSERDFDESPLVTYSRDKEPIVAQGRGLEVPQNGEAERYPLAPRQPNESRPSNSIEPRTFEETERDEYDPFDNGFQDVREELQEEKRARELNDSYQGTGTYGGRGGVNADGTSASGTVEEEQLPYEVHDDEEEAGQGGQGNQ